MSEGDRRVPGPAGEVLWDSELQPGDTYLEGPYVVFTAQYHLRRGYCCNSDCRHCPYRDGVNA